MRMYACECASIAADRGHIENAEDVFHIKINCILVKCIIFLVNEHMHYNETHDYSHDYFFTSLLTYFRQGSKIEKSTFQSF